MHDAQLAETTCTDQDEGEERVVVHHELRQFRSDASWTPADETLNVSRWFGQDSWCAKVWKLSTSVLRSISIPLALLALATRLYRFALSGWLCQAVKNTNANDRKKKPLALLTRDRSSRAS